MSAWYSRKSRVMRPALPALGGVGHVQVIGPVEPETQALLMGIVGGVPHSGRPVGRVRVGLRPLPPAYVDHHFLEAQRGNVVHERIVFLLQGLPASRRPAEGAAGVPLDLRIAGIGSQHLGHTVAQQPAGAGGCRRRQDRRGRRQEARAISQLSPGANSAQRSVMLPARTRSVGDAPPESFRASMRQLLHSSPR